MKTKILYINDGESYENWGLQTCSEQLKYIIYQSVENAEITTLTHKWLHKKYSYEPQIKGKRIFLDDSRFARRFIPLFHNIPEISDEFEWHAKEWMEGRGGPGSHEFIEKAKQSNAVVFNAEGSTYRNNLGAKKALFMIWLAKNYLNKKSFFLNGSVTLTHIIDPILPAIVKKVFESIDGVTVREPKSENVVKRFAPKAKCILVPDSAFQLYQDHIPMTEKAEQTIQSIGGPYFCFSKSMLPMDYKNTKNESSLHALLIGLKKIVPNVIIMAKDVEDQYLKRLAEDVGGLYVGPKYNTNDVMAILSKSEFLISGRYHHLIFACCAGCPIVPLRTSSHKIDGLSEFFEDFSHPPFDPTAIRDDHHNILLEVKNLSKNTSELRQKFKEISSRLKNQSFHHGHIISGTEEPGVNC